MKRRKLLKSIVLTSLGINISGIVSYQNIKKPGTILIVSGWQDINIGDIAHTPGLLNILQTFLPDTELILWKKSAGSEVEAWLSRNFPGVRIIHGDVDADFNVSSSEVKDAFRSAGIMIMDQVHP